MRALRYIFYVLQEGFFLKETTLLWWWTRKLNQNSLCPPQYPPLLICS
jgi:protein involved in sex pheromone biosynthesis